MDSKRVRADLSWHSEDHTGLWIQPQSRRKLPIRNLPGNRNKTVTGMQFELVSVPNYSIGQAARRDRELLSRGVWTRECGNKK
jgi:hypothetical protein